MPLRAPKMYGFIFGFQRLVWCPKWTPASSSWRMVMPCAGCMACCMPVASAATGGGAVVVDVPVSTFSAIARFLLHLRRAKAVPLREPRPDREVCVVGLQGLPSPTGKDPGKGGAI